MSSNPSQLEKALALAARGFAVFPLQPGGRKPMPGSHGFKDATREPWVIEAWWAETPTANIAIAPDLSDPPLIVIDVEGPIGHAVSGAKELARLRTEGVLPSTLSSDTPSGGTHLFYRAPERGAYRSGVAIAPGLDVRATGSYATAPGTILEDGRAYSWREDAPIAEAPIGLLWMLKRTGERKENGAEWLVEPDLPANIRRAQDWIETVAPAQHGTRNETAFKTAAVLRDFGVSRAKALEILSVWNTSNLPPLEAGELSLATHSAYKNAQNAAGSKAASTEVAALLAASAGSPADPPKPAPKKEAGWWMYRDEMKNLPPPRWLVQDTIAEASVCLLYGAWGGGKTLTALALGLSIATGRDWHGHKCEPGAVAYVTAEGVRGIDKRITAWEKAAGVDVDRARFLFCHRMPNWGNDEELAAWASELKAKIAAAPLKLVIVDTISWAMVGWGDENDTADAGVFMKKVGELAEALGCAVLLLHHTGAAGTRSRGSEEYPAKADTILRTEHEGQGLGLRLTIKMLKQKDGEPWRGPLKFRAEQSGPGVVLVQSSGEAPGVAGQSSSLATPAAERMVWVAAVIEVLQQTPPGALPISRKHLAAEVAARLMPEGNQAPLAAGLADWLRKGAESDGLGPYIALRSNAGTASAFSLPKADAPEPGTQTPG